MVLSMAGSHCDGAWTLMDKRSSIELLLKQKHQSQGDRVPLASVRQETPSIRSLAGSLLAGYCAHTLCVDRQRTFAASGFPYAHLISSRSFELSLRCVCVARSITERRPTRTSPSSPCRTTTTTSATSRRTHTTSKLQSTLKLPQTLRALLSHHDYSRRLHERASRIDDGHAGPHRRPRPARARPSRRRSCWGGNSRRHFRSYRASHSSATRGRPVGSIARPRSSRSEHSQAR